MARPALTPAALSPAMFSMVLGTGGVSLCSNMLGWRTLAVALLALNALFITTAWIATALRFVFGRTTLWVDATDLARGPSFFFAPLATAIFGIQIDVLTKYRSVIGPLWIFAVALWILICCVFVVGASVRESKLAFADAISPTWFLPGAALIVIMGFGTHVVSQATEARWIGLYGGLLLGLFFNLAVMAALLARWFFYPIRAEQLQANNWINMGGFAIVVVAGTKLAALSAQSFPPGAAVWMEVPIRPLVIFSWVVATWWIPILIAIGIWRHVRRRVPFRYELPYWALVFSPSVYALATAALVLEYNIRALLWVPPLFALLAGFVWIVLMAGFVRSLFRL